MEKKFPKFLVMGVTAAFLLFTQLVQAAHIIEIASDEAGVLFALDNEGYVWGARERGPILWTGKLMILYQLVRRNHEAHPSSYFHGRIQA